eukprot:759024-Hanusia_phi.AAC.3
METDLIEERECIDDSPGLLSERKPRVFQPEALVSDQSSACAVQPMEGWKVSADRLSKPLCFLIHRQHPLDMCKQTYLIATESAEKSGDTAKEISLRRQYRHARQSRTKRPCQETSEESVCCHLPRYRNVKECPVKASRNELGGQVQVNTGHGGRKVRDQEEEQGATR